VVTGCRLHRQLEELGVPHVTPENNPGFAASVHFGASQEEWDWLYLVNDDVVILEDIASVVAEIDGRDPSERHLFFLDSEDRRPLPTPFRVFMSVALLDPVRARLRGSRPAAPAGEHWYKSFSAVAISHGLWDALGGLDRRFPYTYEDVDFTQRARAAGAEIHEVVQEVVRHEGSGTSRRFVGRVLPVSVYSAREYLETLGHARWVATGTIVAALLVRTFTAPLADADLKDHWKGIAISLAGLAGHSVPRLPPYEEN